MAACFRLYSGRNTKGVRIPCKRNSIPLVIFVVESSIFVNRWSTIVPLASPVRTSTKCLCSSMVWETWNFELIPFSITSISEIISLGPSWQTSTAISGCGSSGVVGGSSLKQTISASVELIIFVLKTFLGKILV